ncbi:hypothetical protein HELRODRAFT_141144, partial [Helobdella robusta]|uniref:Cytochrome P450 n=1 Tax=Helobdella robusta TaxID=6412 RepID=T1EJ27_HELRO
LMEKSKSLGNVFAFYMGNRYVVVLNGRKVLHEALVKHSISFSSRPKFYLHKYINKKLTGIIEHPYDKHFKIHHRICLNILKHFGFGRGVMEARIKVEVEDLIKRVKIKNGEAFNPLFEITAAVSNVICSIIFGKRWSKEDPKFQKGLELINSILLSSIDSMLINFFPIIRFLPSYKKSLNQLLDTFDKWDKYLENVINEAVTNDTENSQKDLFDKDQFTNTIRDLFIAGTETTATTLSWLIILMANNPDVQQKVQEELDRVVGLKRFPCLEDKTNLPITEATILEVMRFKTLVPLALPHLTTKETIIDGVLIPSNVMVMPNIYSAHMNSDDWDEPEKFKIERFLNEDQTQVINRDLIIPFSLGKRSCLGEILAKQELFLFTTALLQKFKMLPVEGETEIIVEETVGVTTSPSHFEARLVSRN